MADISFKEINSMVLASPCEMIRKSEEKYDALIDSIAERVTSDKNVRIVLLAGPSGSGKTTTANLLADRIKLHGEECLVVSLDDFYRDFDDPGYPRFSTGERDFESCEALDVEALVSTLNAIAQSREFILPKYDFKCSRRVEQRVHEAMPDGCVIIEGLHALNPMIFSSLPKEKCLKIFISVSTNVIDDRGERLISGRKIRFIRRMVRDSIYRNSDAKKTLEMWKGVLKGEDKYLYPNRIYADIGFDTFHLFELSVMRKLVESLIGSELAASEPYANTVLNAVRAVLPIDPNLVPEDSLIKEFIPGGIYESLY